MNDAKGQLIGNIIIQQTNFTLASIGNATWWADLDFKNFVIDELSIGVKLSGASGLKEFQFTGWELKIWLGANTSAPSQGGVVKLDNSSNVTNDTFLTNYVSINGKQSPTIIHRPFGNQPIEIARFNMDLRYGEIYAQTDYPLNQTNVNSYTNLTYKLSKIPDNQF